MSNVKLSNKADTDLKNIISYTAENYGEAKAANYTAYLEQAMSLIVQFPRMGQHFKSISTGYECLRYRTTHHDIFYEIDDEGILIIRILHVARETGQYL